MKLFAFIVGSAAFVLAGWAILRRVSPDNVEYQGHRIRLSKMYFDYDVYKNDPQNIHASETDRVIELVSNAKIARTFDSRDAVVAAVFDLQFPGYGVMGFGDSAQGEDSSLLAFAVEIPRAGKDRILVFRREGDRYTLIDDFLGATELFVRSVRDNGQALVFENQYGQQVLLRAKNEG